VATESSLTPRVRAIALSPDTCGAYRGMSHREAAAIANRVGSLAVQKLGATTAMEEMAGLCDVKLLLDLGKGAGT